VRDALAQRPTALRALRVLVGEITRVESASRQPADWIDVDAASLLGGPVVAVLRVNGALPDDATWLAFLARTLALGGLAMLVLAAVGVLVARRRARHP